METGIMAAVPVIFTPYKRHPIDENNFAHGFFDNFDIEEINAKKTYVIKKDLLINNYRQFLSEFYGLIGEDFFKETQLTHDAIPNANSLDEFFGAFSGEKRNSRIPFVYNVSSMFSAPGCRCEQYWLFYSGSHKAHFEAYTTLLHFEKILAKAMKNPLGNAVKFGIFG
ncbi:MAG: hypothetical protein LBC99_02515 [Spirochaetota bacterium]|jgi:hypothetical protein|nr:hypothetical protein [Spirochaetota bacterium]